MDAKFKRRIAGLMRFVNKDLIHKKGVYPHISLLLDSSEDNWTQFRETMAKQDELLLCVIGQEMPLINGKRRNFNNIQQGDIADKYGFKSTWDMNISILSILEKEWGYAKIEWGKTKN